MKTVLFIIFVLILLLLVSLYAWRLLDHRADRIQAKSLAQMQPVDPPLFHQSMVEGLPEPAQRFFQFSILDGTPLYTVAEISMSGQFAMGDKDAPNYISMRAEQVLAAPHGSLWKMSGGTALIKVAGSDSADWTRFWVAGVIPVARAGGTLDHARSAFGRTASEAVFWTPAAVLLGPNVIWDPVDENTARVTLLHNGRRQAVNVTVDAEGRPVEILLQRWSNANPDLEYRLQPFGGNFSEFRESDGFMLPTHVEAGNFIGTGAYFPFFIANISDILFPR